MDLANLQSLSAAIETVVRQPTKPYVHPGRSVDCQHAQPAVSKPTVSQQPAVSQPSVSQPTVCQPAEHRPVERKKRPYVPRHQQEQRQQQQPNIHRQQQKAPPIPSGPKLVTFLGASAEMRRMYAVDASSATETHRVYDFDVSFARLGVDYVPLNGFFIALDDPPANTFVAASLLLHSRSILGTVTRMSRPSIFEHEGSTFLHLNFAAHTATPPPGLFLLACERETFVVRVVLCQPPGPTLFLRAEGLVYADEQVRARMHSGGRFSYGTWWATAAGEAPVQDVVTVHGGRMYCQTAKPQWEFQHRGPPNCTTVARPIDDFPMPPTPPAALRIPPSWTPPVQSPLSSLPSATTSTSTTTTTTAVATEEYDPESVPMAALSK